MEFQTASVNQETFKKEDAYVIRDRASDDETIRYIDEQVSFILNHRGLQHPFLREYSQEGLSEEQSKLLYLETYFYFEYLPFYVSGISTITRDEGILRSIVFNAADELGESESHSDLYKKFLAKKGISQEEIENYECLPSTTALNNGIRALYSTPPIECALGALFADETMSAAMVEKYNGGLIREGVSEEERFFWILHIKVEVGHSNAVFNIISKYLKNPHGKKMFETGIKQYMHLMEKYWDGIEKKIAQK